MSDSYFHYYEYHGETVYLQVGEYADGSLNILMFTTTSEPYATVNVDAVTGSADEQAVDTVNHPDLLDWLVDNGIATNLHKSAYYGGLAYWVARFNLDMMD